MQSHPVSPSWSRPGAGTRPQTHGAMLDGQAPSAQPWDGRTKNPECPCPGKPQASKRQVCFDRAGVTRLNMGHCPMNGLINESAPGRRSQATGNPAGSNVHELRKPFLHAQAARSSCRARSTLLAPPRCLWMIPDRTPLRRGRRRRPRKVRAPVRLVMPLGPTSP